MPNDSPESKRIPVIVDGRHIADVDVSDLAAVLERGDLELRTGLDGDPFLQPVRR